MREKREKKRENKRGRIVYPDAIDRTNKTA